jgi:hypothetical protein
MRWWVVAGVLLLPGVALAHAVGLSTSTVRVDGEAVIAEMAFARADLEGSAAELAARVSVGSGGVPCPGALERSRPIEPDGIQLLLRFRCPRPVTTVTFTVPFIESLGEGHRHLLTVLSDAGETRAVLDRTQPAATVTLGGGGDARSGRLVSLGVEHILTGVDHLVFLFGLLLVGGRARALLRTITSFTLGHSVTLGIGALGVFTPGPRWVEPLIALSIAYVGVENLVHARVEGRWKIALAFGMIHGFGFSGALTQLALPRAQVLPALLAFNMGVELGQLAVLAVVLPLLALARRWPPFSRHGVQVLSAAIVVPGLIWFVARLTAG